MGRERGREGPEKISDDDSLTSTVVGVSGEVINRREQSHLVQGSHSSQEIINQNTGLSHQDGGFYGGEAVDSSFKNLLFPMGYNVEEMSGLTSTDCSRYLQALLQRLGLESGEGAQLVQENSGTQGGGEEAFLSALMNALEHKGISPEVGDELSRMLARLKIEMIQDNKMGTEGVGFQPEEAERMMKEGMLSLDEAKEIMTKLGVSPEEMEALVEAEKISTDDLRSLLLRLEVQPEEIDKIMEEGSIALDRLKEALKKLDINLKEIHALDGSEEIPLQKFKLLLVRLGIAPYDISDAGEMGRFSGKEVSIKEFISLLVNTGQDNSKEIAPLSEQEGCAADTGDGTEHSQKQVGQSAQRHGEGTLVAGKETEGGRAQVNFEQVMSKAEASEIRPKQVVEQIVRVARVQVENGQARATLTLEPPSLGKLSMHIITRDNQVRATFFVETPQVKEIIESNLPQLRQSFLEQGLKVEDFSVFVGYQPRGDQTEQQTSFTSEKSFTHAGGMGEGEEGPIRENMSRMMVGNHLVDFFI